MQETGRAWRVASERGRSRLDGELAGALSHDTCPVFILCGFRVKGGASGLSPGGHGGSVAPCALQAGRGSSRLTPSRGHQRSSEKGGQSGVGRDVLVPPVYKGKSQAVACRLEAVMLRFVPTII